MSMCICSVCGKPFDSDIEGELKKYNDVILEYCEDCMVEDFNYDT